MNTHADKLTVDSAKFLKEVRTLKKLNQQQMAELLAVSLRSYQRYESGESEMGFSQFLRLLRTIDLGGYLDICQIMMKNDFSKIDNRLLKTLNELNSANTKVIRESRVKLHVDEVNAHKNSNEFLVGYWDWSPDTDETFWSENMFEIYGVENKEDMRPENLLQNINDGDKKKIEFGIVNLLTKGIPYHNHHIAIHPDKEVVINASAIISKRGAERFVVGSCKSYVL